MRIVDWSKATPGAAASDSGHARVTLLVRSHAEFIWRVLRRMGLSSADAEDASQQVFMILARKLDQLPQGSERVFLYGAAVRVAANARRGVRRRQEDDERGLELLASPTRGPELSAQEHEEVSELDALLAELPEELCRVLVLADIEGLSGAEIAELEGIPPGTVASRLRRARELFRAQAKRSTVLADRVRVRA